MTSTEQQVLSRTRPWREVELTFQAEHQVRNPYLDVDAWVDFVHADGTLVRRPAFWDGGQTWRVRFASPVRAGRWTWNSAGTVDDPGLVGCSGHLEVDDPGATGNDFFDHGFWTLSQGRRSLVHADGKPALFVGDTAWALPWRATEEEVCEYARDRHSKGFNAALLMTVQPDMDAVGPRDRRSDEGFDVGFEDLPSGRLRHLVPEYFQRFDRLSDVLLAHQIALVLQPVFHGFGWKGLRSAGPHVAPQEYARYCRYLVARYGARPVLYLVGADGTGREPSIAAGGAEVEAWDAYGQPTGIHYRPHISTVASQDAAWLDFQWCQTGHKGEHVPERAAGLWRNTPTKAVANGEPTYEHTGWRGNAEGWWQGHEAWSNLCAGGTMGVIYGAASLWQWRRHPAEPGHEPYFLAPDAGWREALDFEGSKYVGLVRKILAGLPTTDMEPDWWSTFTPRGLAVPGRLYISYLENGGKLTIKDPTVPLGYRVVDPRTGAVVREGQREAPDASVPDDGGAPRLYIFYDGGWPV